MRAHCDPAVLLCHPGGLGGSPNLAMRMGEGNREEAQRVLNNGFLMLLVLSGVLTALFLLLREPLLMCFGASEATFPYANTYLTIYTAGTFFALMATGMKQLPYLPGPLRPGHGHRAGGRGDEHRAGPGVHLPAGAGRGGRGHRHRHLPDVLLRPGALLPAAQVHAGAAGVGRLPVAGHCAHRQLRPDALPDHRHGQRAPHRPQRMLQRYGGPGEGDILVTCGTIVQSYMCIITMPMGGITGGCQSVVSFNYGAGQPERIKKAIGCICALCLAFTTLMTLFTHTLSPLFVRLFTADASLMARTVAYIKVYTFGIIPLAVQYTLVDETTAMGHLRLALFCSLFRKATFLTGTVLFPILLTADAAFYAEPVCDVFCAVVTTVLFLVFFPRMIAGRMADLRQMEGKTAKS